ncbi:MAG: endonuclease/exonuclease/phosphatase family protein [Microthrixaceae bacterium]
MLNLDSKMGRKRLEAKGSTVMVLIASALVLSVSLLACTPPPSDPGSPPTTLVPLPEPPSEFNVLSYNVAGLPQEISKANPQKHIPLISPLLNAYDVVLTQEDFDWWQPAAGILDFVNYHTRLRSQATHPYRTDRHPGPAAVGVNAAARPLLVGDGIGVMSRFPLTGEDHHAWSGCYGDAFTGAGDCLAMKGFRVVTMTLGDAREVDVYSLHAEAGSGAKDQALQARDFEELSLFIRSRGDDRAVILGGDTNLHIDEGYPEPNTGEIDRVIWEQLLASTGMTDVCSELECDQPGSIDKFAYRSNNSVQLTATNIEFPEQRFSASTGESLSDHPPVVATFRWGIPNLLPVS